MKPLLPFILIAVLLSSCSSLKTLNYNSRKADPQPSTTASQPKFIERIEMTPASENGPTVNLKKEMPKQSSNARSNRQEEAVPNTASPITDEAITEVDNSVDLQHKYATLLNTDASQLQNAALLKGIDNWYGTRYRMGGTTKDGIDCSAFVCAIYASVYGVSLPRMAKDQYRFSHHISRTKLQEGDLLFFNTRGGVSHVGIYLQNNKFVHASTSRGVTVSDMFETYYLRRFVGAGRIANKVDPVASN